MHLKLTAIVVIVLALAWRWEWIGTAAFTVMAAAYYFFASSRNHPEWALLISGPWLLTAGLFLANRLKRAELRTKI